MDCRPGDLQDLAYGFLDGEAERRVRRHTATCERCAADLGRLVAEQGILARASEGAEPGARRARLAAVLVPAAFAAALLLGLVWTMAPRNPAPADVAGFQPLQEKKVNSKEAPPPLDEAGLRKEIARLELALEGTSDKQERNRIQAAIDGHKIELARAVEGKPVKKGEMVEKPVKKGPARYDELTKALEKNPNDPETLIARAEEGLKTKRWDPSEQDARKAVELAPANARAHWVLGMALGMLKRLPESEAEFALAAKLDPKMGGQAAQSKRTVQLQFELESIYGKMKMSSDPQERARLDMRAKEIGNELKLLSQGDRPMVNIKEVELRLQENPDDVPALVDRAAWYLDSAKAAPALKDLDRAIALKPDHAPAYLKRAVAHAWLGDTTRAWADAKKGEQLDPKDARAIEMTQGTIKKLSQKGQDKQRPAGELALQIEGLKERLEELRSMSANAELPAAERDRAAKEADRVAAEIEKLKAELQARPAEPEKKVEKKK